MTITKLQLTIMTLSVTLIAAGGMSDAFAMPQIRLTEGGGANNALITDQVFAGDADENNIAGIVSYSQKIGVFDNINFEAGITKPNTGSPTMPNMDFFLISSSSAAGTLVAEFTDVDFTNELIQCQSVGGGTTAGTVTYTVYMDPGNVPFGQAQLLFTTTQSGAGPIFNIDANGAFSAAPGATYSLTMVAEIEHFAANHVSSFDIGLVCSSKVAGELLPIDNTALMIAGLSSITVWMVPAVVGLAGVGVYLVKFRTNRD